MMMTQANTIMIMSGKMTKRVKNKLNLKTLVPIYKAKNNCHQAAVRAVVARVIVIQIVVMTFERKFGDDVRDLYINRF